MNKQNTHATGATSSAQAAQESKTTVNYTPRQAAALVEQYTSANSDNERAQVVEEQAKILDKSPRSVIGKLSRMGEYIKPERTDKTGKKVAKKSDLIERIAPLIGLASEQAGSLEAANKSVLKAVLETLEAE